MILIVIVLNLEINLEILDILQFEFLDSYLSF